MYYITIIRPPLVPRPIKCQCWIWDIICEWCFIAASSSLRSAFHHLESQFLLGCNEWPQCPGSTCQVAAEWWAGVPIRGVKVFTMFRHSPLLTIDSFNEEKMKVGAFSEYCDLYTAKFRCHLYCPCVWRTRGVPCSQHPGDDYHLITLLLPSAACLEMPHLTDSHLPHSALSMSCRNDASNKARVPSRYVQILPQIRPATVLSVTWSGDL